MRCPCRGSVPTRLASLRHPPPGIGDMSIGSSSDGALEAPDSFLLHVPFSGDKGTDPLPRACFASISTQGCGGVLFGEESLANRQTTEEFIFCLCHTEIVAPEAARLQIISGPGLEAPLLRSPSANKSQNTDAPWRLLFAVRGGPILPGILGT